MDEQGTSIASRLEASRKDLLDLGLRNPLLNYRPSSSKGIEVVDELPTEVFRILVREGRTMTFKAGPESPVAETSGGHEDLASAAAPTETDFPTPLLQPDEPSSGGPAERHLDRQLQTTVSSEKLQSRLLRTERDARTFMEEQGVNLLFLALGMLRWYEAESSEEVRKAPLVLVPVSLDRSDAMQRFRLSYTGEELWENLSLKAKLKLEFGISLPEMAEHEDLSVEEYFDALDRAVAAQRRWSVDRSAISLGFFSFSKFLMYRDLDDEQWPEDKKLTGHSVIGSLLGDGDLGSYEQIPDDEHVDRHLAPHETQQVVNADSSQALTLLDVEKGCNLVVQGPPGTGKSQTITNVIAEAVGRGQTVLFVSEKMAALEVVKRRLDSTGFGDACLELHSRKTKKKTVLDELSNTLTLGRPKVAKAEDDLQALHEARDELNAYSEAVNTEIGRSGFTPHQAMGELVRQGRGGAEAPRLSHGNMHEWTSSEFRQAETLVEGFQNKVARIGEPRANPFHGTGREVLVPTDRPGVERSLHAAKESAERLGGVCVSLASVAGLPPPENRSEAESLLEAARKLRYAPDLSGMRPESSELSARPGEISRLTERLERYAALRSEYEEVVIPEAWEQDLLEVREHLASQGGKLLRFMSGDYREAHRKLAGLCASEPPKDAGQKLALVDAILEAQRHEKVIEGETELGQSVFGDRWLRKYSEWRALKAAASFLIPLHEEVSAGRIPEEILGAFRASPDEEGLDQEIPSVKAALEDHASAAETALAEIGLSDEEFVRDRDLTEQAARFGEWSAELDLLEDMISYNRLARQLAGEDLEGVVEIAETWSGAAHGLVDVLRYSFCEALIKRAIEERPALDSFDRESHEHTVERFRRLDGLLIEHNRARLAHAHWQQLPRHQGGGQLAVLKHEMNKKRRHLPLRRLMSEAGNAVQAIKPVFMMSPLSVANFLEPGALEFDLVVFDEASQVKPVEALGAIARGRQTVVVGDDKQLPPTSFFDALMDADEDEENLTGDLESVLGLFSSRGAPERMLRWHYRSRHESLINVSNHEFYENRLTVFPSPSLNGGEVGLFYRHLPETYYERGTSRTNPEEAREVAAAVMEHARGRPGLTLGVAAFSVSQAQAIQDQLEILRRKDPACEEFFGAHPFEPFFVKNLENVQGDERDVIFISVGYGKDQNGHLAMSFGPLNKEGGERRLNVLITRARRRCEVFANFTADDLDLSRTGARGVRALKTFLRYAAEGSLETPLSMGETESPFEDSVLAALRTEGYRVDTQIGSAGFFIDLAVVDPERPGRYVLGVECDGASYHSARSARDRDRLRQEVLEGLGWRIHRVWSTDWFKRPHKELERLVAVIEEARISGGEPEESVGLPPDEETPVVRSLEEEDSEERAAFEPPLYEMAELDPLPYEIHRVRRGELARSVFEVTRIESPVHIDEVARRIAEAASVSRVGRRIREAVESACDYAIRDGRVSRSGDFLWLKNMQEPPIRDRGELPTSSRKHDLVAPEEIKAAVKQVVEDSFGIGKSEIPPAVLRLLGFGRTSETARQTVTRRIEEMVSDGSLTEENGHITG